jgi:hypothetical protein
MTHPIAKETPQDIQPRPTDTGSPGNSQEHPPVYYTDTGLNGENIIPSLIIRDIDVFKSVLKAVERARGSKSVLADSMRQRLGITDPSLQKPEDQESFITAPSNVDWTTGSEADWEKHWSHGDYDAKIYRGEMARQLRHAIGEAATLKALDHDAAVPDEVGTFDDALGWNTKPQFKTEELEKILADSAPTPTDRAIKQVDERVNRLVS